MMEANNTNQKGMTLSALNSASFWSNVAVVALTVLAAIAGIFALYFSLKRDAAKDAEDVRFKDSARVAISGANARAAEAGATAAEAQERAAHANERAAVADQRAAEANLELAKLKQPRALTDHQKRRIAGKIEQFRGQNFAAYSFSDDESLNLANAIGHALFAAGWVVQSADSDIAIGKLGVTMVSGLLIEISPNAAPRLSSAAHALADALTAENLPCQVVASQQRNKSANNIHIFVGKKPIK